MILAALLLACSGGGQKVRGPAGGASGSDGTDEGNGTGGQGGDRKSVV